MPENAAGNTSTNATPRVSILDGLHHVQRRAYERVNRDLGGGAGGVEAIAMQVALLTAQGIEFAKDIEQAVGIARYADSLAPILRGAIHGKTGWLVESITYKLLARNWHLLDLEVGRLVGADKLRNPLLPGPERGRMYARGFKALAATMMRTAHDLETKARREREAMASDFSIIVAVVRHGNATGDSGAKAEPAPNQPSYICRECPKVSGCQKKQAVAYRASL